MGLMQPPEAVQTETRRLERILEWCEYDKSDLKMRSAFFAQQSKDILAGLKTDEELASYAGFVATYEFEETVLRYSDQT